MLYSNLTHDSVSVVDVSQYNFPIQLYYMLPQWEVTVKACAFVPVILFGVFGNIILIIIISRNRPLRTPTNLLIANMAVADLLTVLICPIVFMFHDFYQNYQLGAFGCKSEGFLQASLLVTGVLNLCGVSYDRLTAIVLPQEKRVTIKGAKKIMISTWIIGCALSSPLLIYRTYKERVWKDFLECYCSENTSILPMYWHVLISALVWFPLAVMVICYSAIFWKLDRYEQKVLKREHPISVSYKTKVAKMLFIVLITFVILRLPFTCLVFIRNQMIKQSVMNQVEGSFHILWFTSHYLIFFNAAINPIIYGMTNDNFRRAYHKMPFCRRIFKQDPDIKKNIKVNSLHTLQPRGPCGDQKLGPNSFWTIFQNNRHTKSTGVSKIKPEGENTIATYKTIIESKSDSGDKFLLQDSIKFVDGKGPVAIGTQGFI